VEWAVVEVAEALVLSGVLGGDVVSEAEGEEEVSFSRDEVELSVFERH
jgi:hypothetical protein